MEGAPSFTTLCWDTTSTYPSEKSRCPSHKNVLTKNRVTCGQLSARMLPLQPAVYETGFALAVVRAETVACGDAQLRSPRPRFSVAPMERGSVSPSPRRGSALSARSSRLAVERGGQRPGAAPLRSARPSVAPSFRGRGPRCSGAESPPRAPRAGGGRAPTFRCGEAAAARARPGPRSTGAHGDGAGPAPAAGDSAVTQRSGGAGLGRPRGMYLWGGAYLRLQEVGGRSPAGSFSGRLPGGRERAGCACVCAFGRATRGGRGTPGARSGLGDPLCGRRLVFPAPSHPPHAPGRGGSG